ncbi:SDR family NAD(P)-dependent oxidoreductase [Pseudoclavibacter chungangensis]|uniref:SDR family NAD(P)-dependent oxidoreductase n=1 Tax=Pseudoclavibacter chungangensis TaxID=587635 RepID=A0A7J5BNI2_9MICO|nr:SDR family NAD(P)-dependent oxidoreductase [Pseudoclavibacter chungangensis]KAB1653590.1 SDR family NAD(P)-dependent oxidoreductase [Pseudoclavibacter chungangensis]NYJ68692.1 NAD(P)-dependent dehydrogenase (short-subunit alcohol dehydrogenase family) [Pseudoclavibacter chungangensis]
MPTIAIIGAGPGLGLALARRFGRAGHSAALISRNEDRLDALVAQLAAEDIDAAGFVADAGDPYAVSAALDDVRERFGFIDVLEFSPHIGTARSMTYPLDVTVENLRPIVETMLFGAVTAVQAVLPAMRERGTGTVLLTAGTGSIDPVPMFGALNTAQAATRNWAMNLNRQLAETDVYVAHVAIGVGIGDAPPAPGYPFKTPAQLAELYWDLHVPRQAPELVVGG